MKRLAFVLLCLGFVLLPSTASAHPPAVDPHNACVVRGWQGAFTPPVDSVSTLSYLAPIGTGHKCFEQTRWGFPTHEWGSHAGVCPPPPFVGVVVGAYCGPVVPAGSTATCSWFPVVQSIPTGLIIGFDVNINGRVSLTTDGENPVFGPFPSSTSVVPPTGWTAPNPFAAKARVIAFPTALGPFPPGATAPGDVSKVICVTP